jgi:periplasmic divalent cation tolerance protein
MGTTQTEVMLVLCNAPDGSTARQLAHGLIEARLAACVNLLAPVESVYHWEGKVETSTEVPLLIKTTRAAWPQVLAQLAEQHPYAVPEIIALPVTAGLPAYLDWVSREVSSLPRS